MPESQKSVLFICLGNICRSPAAEGVMRHLIDARGLGNVVSVDSAGTSGYHINAPADKRMQAAARARGYELTSRSRKVSRRDLSQFDRLIAMDRDNYRELHLLCEGGNRRIRLLSDFLDDAWPREVPDPYFGGDAGFEHVLDMLEAACPKLLDELLGELAAEVKPGPPPRSDGPTLLD